MTRPSLRPPAVLTCALGAALLLGGCTSLEAGTATPASTPAGSSAATSSDPGPGSSDDLGAGLLPSDAFGAGATVTPLTEAELQQGAAVGADLSGLTVTPETCAKAIQDSQPGVADLDAFAAQSATSGQAITIELISVGGAEQDPVGALTDAVADCPQATVTSPEIGTATIAFALLEVPDLGDGSAALSYTTTVTGPDGTALAIPALVGVVADGDRLVTLVTTSLGGTVDQAGFGALLQQAFDHQADALD